MCRSRMWKCIILRTILFYLLCIQLAIRISNGLGTRVFSYLIPRFAVFQYTLFILRVCTTRIDVTRIFFLSDLWRTFSIHTNATRTGSIDTFAGQCWATDDEKLSRKLKFFPVKFTTAKEYLVELSVVRLTFSFDRVIKFTTTSITYDRYPY